MPRGGSRPGERRGGRKKGTPNKVTTEFKAILNSILERKAEDIDRWLTECGDGIEVERTTTVKGPDGKEMPVTVLGRQNADPGKAVGLLLQAAEYFHPKLARTEKTIVDATDEELLTEIRRRKEAEAKS